MNKITLQDDFLQLVDAFKHGTNNSDSLIQRFTELLSESQEISEDLLSELITQITKAELPPQLKSHLKNLVDPATKLANKQTKTASAEQYEMSTEDNSKLPQSTHTHTASLLDNLLRWDEDTQESPIEANQIIRDTYCLEQKVGSGGMGEVWKAIDRIQDAGDYYDKYVAIKFISHEIRSHGDALRALVREFARYKKLIHPNIVKAYELNRHKGEVFIVMEFLKGTTLKEFIIEHSVGTQLKQAKPIIEGVCSALEYAHGEGILHMDLKPSNIFHDPSSGDTKVIDFGIARLSDQLDRDKTLFDPGNLGAITTSYASAEMWLMNADPDARDDIYSLACVVYELLSGKHPFNGELAIKAEKLNLKPKPIKNLSEAENKALLHGLSFSRKDRTPTIKQFKEELFSPQKATAQKRLQKQLKISFAVVSLIVVLGILYKTYDYITISQIKTAIAQQDSSGIENFKSLALEDQLNLLADEAFRLNFIGFLIGRTEPDLDALQVLLGLDSQIHKLLFKDRDIRKSLISHYIEKVNQVITLDNFSQAKEFSNAIIEIYPDSKSLSDQAAGISQRKARRLGELERTYLKCLTNHAKPLPELLPCLRDTRVLLGKIAPNHRLLVDPGLSLRYENEVSTALSINDLSSAKNLIVDWKTLLKTDPARSKLEQVLTHKTDISNFIARLITADKTSLPKIIDELNYLESNVKAEILQNKKVIDSLLSHFRENAQTYIQDQNFAAGLKYIEQAANLFPDKSSEQKSINSLGDSIREKNQILLTNFRSEYEDQLKQDRPNINKIISLHDEILTLDPDSDILSYPGFSKSFSPKINNAIKAENFDLANGLVRDWKKIQSDNDELISLSTKIIERYQIYQNRNKLLAELKTSLESKQITAVADFIGDLQEYFSRQDRQLVLENVKQSLVSFYQEQVISAIDKDDFSNAKILVTNVLILYPKEQTLADTKKRIRIDQKDRIKFLVDTFKQSLQTESPSGEKIFSPLKKISFIDDQYLQKNQHLYRELEKRLLELTKVYESLPYLTDILDQWEKFFLAPSFSDSEREIYRNTRNIIALRCLFNGRQLNKQGNQSLGAEFFMLGLTLNPVSTVRNALEQELNR